MLSGTTSSPGSSTDVSRTSEGGSSSREPLAIVGSACSITSSATRFSSETASSSSSETLTESCSRLAGLPIDSSDDDRESSSPIAGSILSGTISSVGMSTEASIEIESASSGCSSAITSSSLGPPSFAGSHSVVFDSCSGAFADFLRRRFFFLLGITGSDEILIVSVTSMISGSVFSSSVSSRVPSTPSRSSATSAIRPSSANVVEVFLRRLFFLFPSVILESSYSFAPGPLTSDVVAVLLFLIPVAVSIVASSLSGSSLSGSSLTSGFRPRSGPVRFRRFLLVLRLSTSGKLISVESPGPLFSRVVSSST
mmetsp:Transcript_30670/g.73001  ORF Transcript_30670/g.73001 Transcript_30670/m.73001 type:complete len:311 (+) Transcript_30670:1777-2709(+)